MLGLGLEFVALQMQTIISLKITTMAKTKDMACTQVAPMQTLTFCSGSFKAMLGTWSYQLTFRTLLRSFRVLIGSSAAYLFGLLMKISFMRCVL